MSTTAAGTAIPVIALSNWGISLARDRFEVTAFGDSNKQYVQGLPDISGSFGGWWDDTEDTIFDAADNAEAVKMYLYPDRANAETKYWYGTAYVDISEVTTDVGGAVTVAGTFQAAGTWARM